MTFVRSAWVALIVVAGIAHVVVSQRPQRPAWCSARWP